MRPLSASNRHKIRILVVLLIGWSCQLVLVRCFTVFTPMKKIVRLQESVSGAESPPSACPFSKPFPRYRIDLTRIKDKKETSWLPNPFKNLSQSMEKTKLERQVGKDEVLIWEPELDGVAAFSLLWDRAAKLIVSSNHNQEVIALPHASQQLIQNWVEIIEWMGTNSVPKQMDHVLEASLINDDNMTPAVRIQRIANLSTTSSTTATTNVEILTQRTQAWVKRILVQQGICPFTKSVRKSGHGLSDVGVPVGAISYHGSSATHPILLFADTWKAIFQMIQAGPSGKEGVSSILLAAPGFDDDFDLWAGPIFAMLEAGVVAASAQAQIGVVCFHPRYATPDGKSWPGFGHMHSVPRLQKWYEENNGSCPLTTEDVAAGGAWQRRTPHATINVLRADQLEAAEGRRMSAKMYTENIDRLVGTDGIGSEQLAQDLERERQLDISQ